jgi:hypothetical protein
MSPSGSRTSTGAGAATFREAVSKIQRRSGTAPQNIDQGSRAVPIQLYGLTFLAGHLACVPTVGVYLHKGQPINLEDRVRGGNFIVEGIPLHMLALKLPHESH